MYSHFLSQKKNNRKGNKELQVIPGVGPALSKDLNGLGIFGVRDLVRKNPETLYKNLEL